MVVLRNSAHAGRHARSHAALPLDRPPRSIGFQRIKAGFRAPEPSFRTVPTPSRAKCPVAVVGTFAPLPLRGQRRHSTGFPILRHAHARRHLEHIQSNTGCGISRQRKRHDISGGRQRNLTIRHRLSRTRQPIRVIPCYHGHGILLAAPPQHASPQDHDMVSKRGQGRIVARHGLQ